VPQGLSLSFDAVLPFHQNLNILQARLMGLDKLKVVAVVAGAETGVELADQLSEKMNLRTNGTAHGDARRNKYVMGETIRAAGIRAMKQVKATTVEHVEAFLADWQPDPFKVIVKPMDSAGSDDVTLCSSREEVFFAFHRILGKVNGLGIVNKAVLVQEFLDGQEYVIDTVSRGGEHKVVAVWAYDRRAVNGAGFVLFGQHLLTADEPRVRELIEYQKKVITALGIRNGPTHGEVKWFQGEPVLVEVGARCHGVEGVWQMIVDAVHGYNQVRGTIDSYFHDEKFNAIPDVVRTCVNFYLFFVCFSTIYISIN
jgi:biotin carboxylase